jgi:hypothetical protein
MLTEFRSPPTTTPLSAPVASSASILPIPQAKGKETAPSTELEVPGTTISAKEALEALIEERDVSRQAREAKAAARRMELEAELEKGGAEQRRALEEDIEDEERAEEEDFELQMRALNLRVVDDSIVDAESGL